MRKQLLGYLAASTLVLAACGDKTNQEATSPKTEAPHAGSADFVKGPLTPEIINSSPSLSGSTLRRPSISPNGSMVTVLRGREDNASQQDLWAYDLKTGEGKMLVSSTDLINGEEVLSEEEKNRRERAREYGSGIVSYKWVSDDLLLFPLGGDIYLYDLAKKESRQVTATKGFESDPKVSGNGRFATYVRGNNLFVKDLQTGLERQLSDGATETVRNATASFVVQEELARNTGYWTSPNAAMIAYSQIDEREIAVENRLDFAADGVKNISQRYPFAGTKNATVKLGVVPRTGGDTVWVDIGDDKDIYLARVYWSKDSKILYLGILSRDHKSLKMLAADPATGKSRLVFEETSETWINVRGDFKALKDDSFLWTSEKDGFRHVYLHSAHGGGPVQITKGAWPVSRINCINETEGTIYFSGWQESALNQHIFKVNIDGSGLTQLSKGSGWHSANFSRNCAAYIGSFQNVNTPPQTRAFDNTGKPLIWLNENKLDADHPYSQYLESHIDPEFGQLEASDGTKMDYALYKPAGLKDGDKRPAVTIVYGGPGVQRVSNTWPSRNMLAQVLADNGFVVFSLDNRGATNRGKTFEDHLYRKMGQSEVIDQTVGAEFLKSLSFVDASRMGVYGWSYGGYMTLQMLGQTDHYKSGVSGAPVTDWRLYDTAYTERYLGDPNEGTPNYTKGAYEDGAVFAHLKGLTEPVLLIHGMADDNVVFRHSIMLMDAMQKAGKHNMRVQTYPGEKHGFRGTENRIHRDRQILEFFLETL